MLKLYPGHFLAGDDEAPWLLGCRQRLASKFLRHVAAVGQRWQDDGDPGQAELAYQRALELVTNSAERSFLERRLAEVSALG